MRRLITTLVLAASLTVAACTPPRSASDVASQVDRLETRYVEAKGFAEILLPFVSETRAAQIRAAIDRADAAIVAVRAAATLAQLIEARRQAEAATATLTATTTAG